MDRNTLGRKQSTFNVTDCVHAKLWRSGPVERSSFHHNQLLSTQVPPGDDSFRDVFPTARGNISGSR